MERDNNQHQEQPEFFLLPHADDYQLQCSAEELRSFKNGPIWKDVRGLIKERMQYLMEQLISASSDAEIHRLQGQLKALNDLVDKERDFLDTAIMSLEEASRYNEQVQQQTNGQ